ncbi:MAG: hypothetical protein EG828_13970 [Deltaproteobacteria bacterium]|nr:hypothetical protein [Deltaproteobacteria bacterium]
MGNGDYTSNPENILQVLRSTLPLKVLNTKKGHGTFLTFDLKRHDASSNVHLWIYLCDWMAFKNNSKILDSSAPDYSEEYLSHIFKNRQLLDVIESSGSTIHLLFDDDSYFVLSPNLNAYSDEDDLLRFFMPNKKVISFSVEKRFYVE